MKYLASLFVILITIGFTLDAHAHGGKLASKDECHTVEKTGERHWHVEGTNTAGGTCTTITIKSGDAKDPISINETDKKDTQQ